GMNVDCNSALDKSKIRPGERAGHLPGVPAIVERTVRHGITVGKNRRGIVIDDGDSNSVKLLRNICQPFVADLIARSGIVRTVDISAPPKAILLRSDSIGNHSPDGGGRRRIQAAHQQQRCVFRLTNSAEALKVSRNRAAMVVSYSSRVISSSTEQSSPTRWSRAIRRCWA